MESAQQNTPYTNLSTEVQNALNELNADNSKYEPQNANELIKLENSVQIFFVTSDGRVSTFSAPETLRIFQFDQDQGESSSTFLQVGGWTHPLIPGASPCLQAENGAIMFPDIYSDLPDCSVGLVLVEEISEDSRQKLINLLDQHTALKSQTLLPPDQRLGALGSAIVKGAEYLSQGIEIGAEKAGELIEYVTEKSQKKLSKAEEDAKIGSLTRGSINAAKSATTATVKVSGYVANRVGKLTKSMAGYLASKAEKPISGVVSTAGVIRSKELWPTLLMQLGEVLLPTVQSILVLKPLPKFLEKIMKENYCKSCLSQIRRRGWTCVWRCLHGCWECCHDIHEHPEFGGEGFGEEDSKGNWENSGQECDHRRVQKICHK
eukprot:TRINITY_DN1244_c0_g1_i7.p1 TRINITY_DN1244_c0_g1~~TRINITY_DN1244_c0_g1_i7.p1  ORF type:complete len:377 (-),score=97.62 TRINITY_DN1244_c0_g1_i7:276-1406(-)